MKKNSECKNVFWFGYKGHLVVGTSSQYIVQSLFSSGNLNNGKAAIPLLKGLDERLPLPRLKYETMDAGYDYEPIYEQIHRMDHKAVIAYNKRNEPAPIGFDPHFAPTCVREHSYRYDSFDPTYEMLKYTRPKECTDCPLANDELCQKIYKVKFTTDLRKYTVPARGSKDGKTYTRNGRLLNESMRIFQLNAKQCTLSNRQTQRFILISLLLSIMLQN